MVDSTTVMPMPSTDGPEKTLDCDDSPTRVTNSNTSSETASLPPDEQEQHDLLLSALARQLEFYFSPANLSRDTYLQTLQSLNDGYVPVSIIANFAKIQAIYSGQEEHARIQAVVKAATLHTGVLEVAYISTITNKKVSDQDENTILAVGPSKVTSSSSTSLSSLVSPKTPIQNTIIIREAPEDVVEEDVRGLFDESCPPLQDVHEDVANCWFVTLDTTSRDDMMNVMLDLRSKTLKGEAVKARLKAGATPTSSFVGSLDPSAISFPAVHLPSPPASPSRSGGKKTKSKGSKKPARNRRKNSNAGKQQQQHPPSSSPSSPKSKQQQQEPKQVKTAPPPPPKLEEESHFPALATPSVAVDNIADKDNVDKVAGIIKTTADGASTATTASSATSSTATPPVPPAGGYAAALLKAAPPKDETLAPTNGTANKKSERPMNEKLSEKSARPDTVNVVKKEEPKEEVTAMPMSWGSGRSFAQVLKKSEQSS